MTSGLSEGGRGDERVLIKCANVDSDLGGDFFFFFILLFKARRAVFKTILDFNLDFFSVCVCVCCYCASLL